MTTDPIPIGHDEAHYVSELRDEGISAVLVTSEMGLQGVHDSKDLDLALLDVSAMPEAEMKLCVREFTRLEVPTIALVPERLIGMFDPSLAIDDLVISPTRLDELSLRARRLLSVHREKDEDTIQLGDLSINRTNYEVSVRGRSVNLRFKEYELLLLMATNPGRVYTRGQLLESIWGFDYLGGTRTVDVHIRRLRSKIEDRDHQFVETVWNVGYKFRDF